MRPTLPADVTNQTASKAHHLGVCHVFVRVILSLNQLSSEKAQGRGLLTLLDWSHCVVASAASELLKMKLSIINAIVLNILRRLRRPALGAE